MSNIKTLYKGKFVLVDLVDETIELTVENNVYSRSESLELLEELKRACAASRNDFGTAHHETYSKKMQDDLEPIGGMSADWTFNVTDDDKEFEDE